MDEELKTILIKIGYIKKNIKNYVGVSHNLKEYMIKDMDELYEIVNNLAVNGRKANGSK